MDDSVKEFCREKNDAARIVQFLFENINGFTVLFFYSHNIAKIKFVWYNNKNKV